MQHRVATADAASVTDEMERVIALLDEAARRNASQAELARLGERYADAAFVTAASLRYANLSTVRAIKRWCKRAGVTRDELEAAYERGRKRGYLVGFGSLDPS